MCLLKNPYEEIQLYIFILIISDLNLNLICKREHLFYKTIYYLGCTDNLERTEMMKIILLILPSVNNHYT